MFCRLLIFAIFITNLVFGQNYHWPTKTGKQLTSNFGEFRGTHFHMGLDIRTKGSIGHPVYAVDDGYIYRIATIFNGYGKVIYLKTNNGRIAVYGHLDRFYPRLEKRLTKLQFEKQSYFINKYFTKNEYPVKRGDVVGYSGNTGGSFGPHLHFEFRNSKDQPLNPLLYGFALSDNVPPQFLNISLIPLAAGTNINNSPEAYNSIPTKLASNRFTLTDTISVSGTFGIATRVIDKIQNVSNSYQIERLELLVNHKPVFSIKYNLLDFSEGKLVSTIFGQPINNPRRKDLQKLYKLENYPTLSVHDAENTGFLNLPIGTHYISIRVWDAAQNKSTLNFSVSVKPFAEQIKFQRAPQTSVYPKYTNISKFFKPQLIQYEKGVIFKLKEKLSPSAKAMAFIKHNDSFTSIPLKNISNNQYISSMIGLSLFKNHEKCGFLINDGATQQYDLEYTPTLILPFSESDFFSADGLVNISASDAVFDSTLMWITKYRNPINTNSPNRVSDIYELFPYGIPLKNSVDIIISVPKYQSGNHLGLYTFNQKKSQWNYVRSTFDNTNNSVKAKLRKAAVFAVLKDSQPPSINSIFPKHDKKYLKERFKTIKIKLSDNLSGVNSSEEYLQVFLDGRRIWVAYQPIKKEITYKLNNLLYRGKHKIKIKVSDRSGNSSTKSINFFIE